MTRKPVEYLGRQVQCRHCGKEMFCIDSDLQSAAELDPVRYWIDFTDQPHFTAGEFDRNRSPR